LRLSIESTVVGMWMPAGGGMDNTPAQGQRGETGLAYMPERARAVCESARTLLRDARALLAQLELRAG